MKIFILLFLVVGCSSNKVEENKKITQICSDHDKYWSFDNYSQKSDYCHLQKIIKKERGLKLLKENRRKLEMARGRWHNDPKAKPQGKRF